MLIDTHCHLDAEHFPEGPDAVIARARDAGVEHFVVIGVGESAAAAEAAIDLAQRRTDVSATVGMHPHEAQHLSDAVFARLEELARHDEVVAVGEIGLDHHYMSSPAPVQAEVFRRMIGLARAVNKPIVVHTRAAPAETLAILEEEGARDVGGIIHCFSEDRAFAAKALDLDFDVSLSGIVTFKNAIAIQDVARWAPADRIMVETDSPYLAPVPLRGKRNEPANVVRTAAFVAELRGLPVDELARITSDNARRRLSL